MSQKLMPLGDLPKYLQSLKDSGSVGESPAPVVGMGQIIETKKRSFARWSMGMAASLLILVGIVGGMIAYDSMSTEQFTVIVDVTNPQAISQIVANSEGEILSVKQTEGTVYEVKVSTRKSKHMFLEWLRENKDIKIR